MHFICWLIIEKLNILIALQLNNSLDHSEHVPAIECDMKPRLIRTTDE
jgi:hypothetical protein